MKYPPELTCCNINCNRKRMRINGNGHNAVYRAVCKRCHDASGGRDTYAEGVISIKKDYCENHNGGFELGFKCGRTKAQWKKHVKKYGSGTLQLDHIDGNNDNNMPENIQTGCGNCHRDKTTIMRDAHGLQKYNRNTKKA